MLKVLYDRIIFTLGVLRLIITTAVIFGHSLIWAKLMFLFQFITFIIHRWYEFRKTNKELYLVEFCYFANINIVLFIIADYIKPLSVYWFMPIFGLIYGPLIYGILITKDKMYFHSPAHLGSVFLHTAPVALCWKLRWEQYPDYTPSLTERVYGIGYSAIIMYLIWAIGYVITVFILMRDKIYSDKYDSAFGSMVRNPNSILNRCIPFNGRKKEIAYMLGNGILCVSTIFVSCIIFNSYIISSFIPLFILTIVVWNSSKKYCYIITTKKN